MLDTSDIFSPYDVAAISAEVLRVLGKSRRRIEDGNALVVGSHNASYGNRKKGEAFLPAYREFVGRHHLLAWQEVDREFLDFIAHAAGNYSAVCTEPNSRGQAVGFTVHNRLKVLSTKVYSEFRNINGFPDLRPALRLDLLDTKTNLELVALVVHYKSNLGGSKATTPVRLKQATTHAEVLQIKDEFAICLGDYNHNLEFASDADPLRSDGFFAFPRHDRASTHASAGRIDGMFVKNVPANVKLSGYRVRNFWRNRKVGCALSDHGLLSWNIVIKTGTASRDFEI